MNAKPRTYQATLSLFDDNQRSCRRREVFNHAWYMSEQDVTGQKGNVAAPHGSRPVSLYVDL